MLLDDLNKTKEIGVYSNLLKKGAISTKIGYYLELYNCYKDKLLNNKGCVDVIGRSKFDTAEEHNCSWATVHRAIKFIER